MSVARYRTGEVAQTRLALTGLHQADLGIGLRQFELQIAIACTRGFQVLQILQRALHQQLARRG